MVIKKPQHQLKMEKSSQPGDLGGHFPNLELAKNYLSESSTNQAIKEDRIRGIHVAVKQKEFKDIFDFGIGNGVRFKELNLEYKNLVGIDISEHMIELCRENFFVENEEMVHNFYVGDQNSLDDIPSNSFDLILLIHVLGYIPENEHDKLFRNLARILVSGGKLLVSTGNQLFDLFALNSGTKDFFEYEFNVENSDLLLSSTTSERYINADRINPLTFRHFLNRFGLEEIRQAYSQFHHVPPQILIELGASVEDARIQSRSNQVDVNKFSEMEKWRAYFQCSVVVSLSIANKN